jgi:hypothetical protein
MKKLYYILSSLFVTPIYAQINQPIKQHIDSSGIENYKNTPRKISDQEKISYQNYISGTRLGMNFSQGTTFTINSVDQLFKLKEALDLIPTNIYFENNNPIFNGTLAGVEFPCDHAIIGSFNNKKTEDQLSVMYKSQSAMGINYKNIFDVNIVNNRCNSVVDPVFVINEGKQFGFGVGIPNATYHFATGDFLVGSQTAYNFRIGQQGKNFLQFSNNGDILFLVDDKGKVFGKEFEVTLTIPVPDYVFANDYKLMPIKELESFISEHKHLPGVKSAKTYENEGSININELQMKLLEKIEELTLYTIQLQNQIDAQAIIIESLKSKK